jgi:hypothetical protein
MKAFAAALICCRHPLRRRLPIQRRPLQWGHPASSNKLAGSLASLCGHQNAGPKPRALSFRCSNVTNGANGGGANDDASPSDGDANPNAGDASPSAGGASPNDGHVPIVLPAAEAVGPLQSLSKQDGRSGSHSFL